MKRVTDKSKLERSVRARTLVDPADTPVKPKRKVKAAPEPPVLRVLSPAEGIDRWLVLGLDPSLSRTGFAFMLVEKTDTGTVARWLDVGSLKPEDASVPVWIRSKGIALTLCKLLSQVVEKLTPDRQLEYLARTGLIFSLEAPTPGNDFLSSISRILHLVLLGEDSVAQDFGQVHVQMTNASTLRSLMGLTKQGAKNKVENVARAYEFLGKERYPNLDTDACDAVLMGMMGRYAAGILLGHPEGVPGKFLTALCNATEEVVGKGRNSRTRTKGILHRPEYWSRYACRSYDVLVRDARVKKTKLDRISFSI